MLVALIWLFAMAGAPPENAGPSPVTAPTVRDYVRMCHSSEPAVLATLPSAQVAAARARTTANAREMDDRSEAVAQAARSALRHAWPGYTPPPSISSVRVAVWNFQQFGKEQEPFPTPSPTNEKQSAVALEVDSSEGRSWVRATLDDNRNIVDLRPSSAAEVEMPINFARSMAAYELLNDLLASDATIPRKGCIAVTSSLLGDIPIVLPEVDRAFAAVPHPDDATLSALAAAFEAIKTKAQSATWPGKSLTLETLKKLGATPKITVVYDDRDSILGTGLHIDVVRIGQVQRTYAIATIDAAGKAAFGDLNVLCVVGDPRCAPYYVWP